MKLILNKTLDSKNVSNFITILRNIEEYTPKNCPLAYIRVANNQIFIGSSTDPAPKNHDEAIIAYDIDLNSYVLELDEDLPAAFCIKIEISSLLLFLNSKSERLITALTLSFSLGEDKSMEAYFVSSVGSEYMEGILTEIPIHMIPETEETQSSILLAEIGTFYEIGKYIQLIDKCPILELSDKGIIIRTMVQGHTLSEQSILKEYIKGYNRLDLNAALGLKKIINCMNTRLYDFLSYAIRKKLKFKMSIYSDREPQHAEVEIINYLEIEYEADEGRCLRLIPCMLTQEAVPQLNTEKTGNNHKSMLKSEYMDENINNPRHIAINWRPTLEEEEEIIDNQITMSRWDQRKIEPIVIPSTERIPVKIRKFEA